MPINNYESTLPSILSPSKTQNMGLLATGKMSDC